MNVLFYVVALSSTIILLFLSPSSFLETVLQSASKSATLCVSLLSSYALWLGLMQVWEDSGVSKKISQLLRPLTRKLFHTDDEEILNTVTMSLSVNLLGISGASTPYGIRSAQLLDKTKEAEYSSCMLFALNATSLQLIPTSIISVRTAMGSIAPADVLFPTVITSVFSTLFACILVRIFIPPTSAATDKKRKQKPLRFLHTQAGAV